MTPIKYAKQQLAAGHMVNMPIYDAAGSFYLCDADWNILSGSKTYATRDAARRNARRAEARLDAPLTRREVLDAIYLVRNSFGGSGFPEQEALYDAFDRPAAALS